MKEVYYNEGRTHDPCRFSRAGQGAWYDSVAEGALRPCADACRLAGTMRRGFGIQGYVLLVLLLSSIDASAQALPPIVLKYSPCIFSADGQVLGYIGEEHRVEVLSLSQVSRHVVDALIATEDRDFYEHDGVSLSGLGRAILNTLTGKTQGGSTITMQLARNLFLTKEKTLSRKLAEIDLARDIEKKYSKQQILVLYLNTVYFGRGAHGIWAAAHEYFGKAPDKLTLSESAMIVGLLQAPSAYDPSRHADKALRRRNEVLHNLVETQKLTASEYERVRRTPLGLALRDNRGRHAVEFIRREAADILASMGRSLQSEDYRITSTIDFMAQQAAERALAAQWDKFPKAMREAQAGIASVEATTGAIRVMIGGNPTANPTGLNRAAQIRRQPGSSFKPFLYGAVLEAGHTLATPILDAPVVTDSGTAWEWRPENDDGTYTGAVVPLRYAVRRSLNLAAARAVTELTTPAAVAAFAQRCGITSTLHQYPSIALGTAEVSPLEMAASMATFASFGTRARPYAVVSISDKNGRLLYSAKPDTAMVLDSATAFLVTDALEAAVDSGTASSIRAQYRGPAAGKTGTTQRSADAWFVGYTPVLSTAVWIGFDNPARVLTGEYRYGGSACAPVWARFMAELQKQGRYGTATQFRKPSTISYIDLCVDSGELAVEDCPHRVLTPIDGMRPPNVCHIHD